MERHIPATESHDREPKRPWFRFQLLTAVLMMIAASRLLDLNLRERNGQRGWPAIAMYYEVDPDYTLPDAKRGGPYLIHIPVDHPHWVISGIVFNIGFALGTLLLFAVIAESIIRRREGRKPPTAN